MKKMNLRNNIFLVAKKSGMNERKLDYFLRLPDGAECYAFTRNHSSVCYEACKAGIPVNKALYGKKNNTAFMGMVKYLQYFLPYFIEYYELDVETSIIRELQYA
jgi:hypothetical protein